MWHGRSIHKTCCSTNKDMTTGGASPPPPSGPLAHTAGEQEAGPQFSMDFSDPQQNIMWDTESSELGGTSTDVSTTRWGTFR